MRKNHTTLAKLSRPKLFGIVPRIRLYELLDERRDKHPIVWITGPPGSGKTALVASYIESRDLPAIWYQVDAEDSDPATFIYYMGLAGRKAVGRKRLLLPLLTPEYLADLSGFTRRFFRKLFAELPQPGILVLDNYQEVVPDSSFHNIIHGASAELPNDINLIVISHLEPPPQFARALANNLIGQIDWDDLSLTLDETTAIAIASSTRVLDGDILRLLQDQTNGWAAGLVLMVERLKRTGAVNHISRSETMETVFNYFAGQTFDQAPVETREFLMRTAILPRMTVKMAVKISGNLNASGLLNELYRNRLFTDRRVTDEISYQYHMLFREFLLDRGRKNIPPTELLDIKKLGAALTEQNDEIEAAAQLFAEARAWDELARLVYSRASGFLAQGRHQILQEMIDMFPAVVVQNTPWLIYWRGISYMLLDPPRAKAFLEQAYAGFQVKKDSAGLFLACAGVIDAYFFAEDDLKPVINWAGHLEQLLHRYGGFPSFEIEAKVLASLQGLIFAAPHHPLLEMLEERFDKALRSTADPVLRIAIACNIWLPLWRGDSPRARSIIDEITPLLNTASVSPMLRILWRNIEGCYAWSTTASHHVSEKKFREALQIAQEAGISIFNCMLWGGGVYGALSAGNVTAAKECLEQLQANLTVQRKHEIAQFLFLRAGIELLEGNLAKARDDASAALRLFKEMGRPYLIEASRCGLAQILVEIGDMENARTHLAKAAQYARIMKNPMLEHQCLLIEAYSRLKEDDVGKALAPLREALRIGREHDFLFLNFWWRPQVIARLFTLALQSRIEVAYVQSVIRRRGIKAESPQLESWPWQIKIYTLGRFEILCDDIALRSSGKAQHKPLELLKCLCAYGGHAIHQDRLTDALWPDAEGDAAEQALRTTLHRLRKLLKHEQSIQFEDRHLSFDSGYVWVDCLAFDRAAHHPNMADCDSLARELNRYRGSFLPGESAPWAVTFRERLRAQYMHMAEQLGGMLEKEGNCTAAVDCYLKAIEVEPAAENFYRRLMNIYSKLGRRAEAMAVYQRCRQSLLSRFGISPSQETQIIYQTLAKL